MKKNSINHDFSYHLNTEDVFFKTEILTSQTAASFFSDQMYYLHLILEGHGTSKYGNAKDATCIPIHREMTFLINKSIPHTIVAGAGEKLQVLTIGFKAELFE